MADDHNFDISDVTEVEQQRLNKTRDSARVMFIFQLAATIFFLMNSIHHEDHEGHKDRGESNQSFVLFVSFVVIYPSRQLRPAIPFLPEVPTTPPRR